MHPTKQVYLLRHAEKDPTGTLTEAGRQKAQQMSKKLPKFQKIICSDSRRSEETAELLTGEKPNIELRAGFYMASKEKSDLLNTIAREKNASFLEAVVQLNDQEVLKGIDAKATELNQLIDELLTKLPPGANALIVSHDLSISPALSKRGVPLESIDYLSGYIIDEFGKIETYHS